MAYSGTVSTTQFNTRKVVDAAFRRCKLAPQQISAEMQSWALDALYLLLSEIANEKPPSWCIEKVLLPMVERQPIVELPVGTVDVLNLNYRTLQLLTGNNVTAANSLTVAFGEQIVVSTAGILWTTTPQDLSLEVSDDNVLWVNVGELSAEGTAVGTRTWVDIAVPHAAQFFRLIAQSPMDFSGVTLGNNPSEIPLGRLNRDQYVDQSNKVFPGRPTTFWFQRDLPRPVLNLWPAPNPAATVAQLVVWRQRQIMDVGTLRQDLEVPQRWLNAIVAGLATRMADELPQVALELSLKLAAQAQEAMRVARDGDNDGSPTLIQPRIAPYTR